ncbi:ribonucleotide-diphosphate reductase subunit beta [Cognatishimia sp.]|uniref:ribonucleotide-diphosphate reductase subunit beta n=1 Tax=Cognatishimia sp. TaxID=2211648 RepID=UPI00351795E2|nr:ribonucleotide-diphosphate reductase subunit beta [Cognatishimia sp.]
MGIFTKRDTPKPYEYPQCFEFMKLQQQAHWLPTEVPMGDDTADFNTDKLSPEEKNLIVNILRFFTTGDAEVLDNYNNSLAAYFPKTEITMMLTTFAAAEVIHVWAYSQLNDTLGLPDSEYEAFKKYSEMRTKFDILHMEKLDKDATPRQIAKNLAVFGGFIEGVSLFASFCILMNFPRRNLLKNVGTIVSWSIRDENLHSQGVSYLFKEVCKEYDLLDAPFKKELYTACEDIVAAEDDFIDKCFEMGAVEGLSPDQVKGYIRYMANYRLENLGLNTIFDVTENPLPWMDDLMSGKEHGNFFETRATEYSKGLIVGDWE